MASIKRGREKKKERKRVIFLRHCILKIFSIMCTHTWIFYFILLALNLSQIDSRCKEQDNLAVYKIILRTYWSPARFPKDYPDWPIPAQFGKLIGRTHDDTYSLFNLGERSSTELVNYIDMELADPTHNIRNNDNIFDSFDGPTLLAGEGSATTRAFLDSNHTLVSLVSRMTPSPDWFIGLDSFELCIEGQWIDTVTVELDPLDAGIHDGAKFISPKEPSRTQNPIHRITSRYPANLKGSFYYPHLQRLPPIGTITFIKLKEYTMSKLRNHQEIQIREEVIPLQVIPLNKMLDRREQIITDNNRYRYWTGGEDETRLNGFHHEKGRKSAIMSDIVSSYRPTQRIVGQPHDKKPNGRFNHRQRKIHNSTSTDEFDKMHWLSAGGEIKLNTSRKFESKMKKWHKKRGPRDCKLSDWGAWSACSRTCGVGETQRVRKIIIKARRGGRPCQSLRETKWCGSTAPCSSGSNH